MDLLKKFYQKYLSKINKYVLAIIFFLLLVFTASDSNPFKMYKYDMKIRSLDKEIREYKKEIEEDKRKLESLKTDREGLERFAREEYYMKRDDEDLYIIE